jgi:hypothetical protein
MSAKAPTTKGKLPPRSVMDVDNDIRKAHKSKNRSDISLWKNYMPKGTKDRMSINPNKPVPGFGNSLRNKKSKLRVLNDKNMQTRPKPNYGHSI